MIITSIFDWRASAGAPSTPVGLPPGNWLLAAHIEDLTPDLQRFLSRDLQQLFLLRRSTASNNNLFFRNVKRIKLKNYKKKKLISTLTSIHWPWRVGPSPENQYWHWIPSLRESICWENSNYQNNNTPLNPIQKQPNETWTTRIVIENN